MLAHDCDKNVAPTPSQILPSCTSSSKLRATVSNGVGAHDLPSIPTLSWTLGASPSACLVVLTPYGIAAALFHVFDSCARNHSLATSSVMCHPGKDIILPPHDSEGRPVMRPNLSVDEARWEVPWPDGSPRYTPQYYVSPYVLFNGPDGPDPRNFKWAHPEDLADLVEGSRTKHRISGSYHHVGALRAGDAGEGTATPFGAPSNKVNELAPEVAIRLRLSRLPSVYPESCTGLAHQPRF